MEDRLGYNADWGKVASRLGVREGVSVACSLYSSALETVAHLWLECDVAQQIWRLGPWPLNSFNLAHLSMSEWLEALFKPRVQCLGIPSTDIFIDFNFMLLTRLI